MCLGNHGLGSILCAAKGLLVQLANRGRNLNYDGHRTRAFAIKGTEKVGDEGVEVE